MVIDRKEFESIEGWLSYEEGMKLASLASLLSGGVIVEIGSWKGRSTFCLSNGSTIGVVMFDSVVYAIDHFVGSKEHGNDVWTFPEFWDNMKKHGCTHNVIPMIGKSRLAAWAFGDGTIDLLLIDGGHDYADVCNDFVWFFKKMKKGGIICIHDTESTWEGPTKFARELKSPVSPVNFVCIVDSLSVFEVK